MSDSVISRRVEDIDGLFDCLLEQHPEPVCELNFKSPFELLVAVILSAQCTDKRVNEVTSHIFDKYNTPKQFADMRQEDLERMIFSCGFYRNKAANIIAASKDIVDKFGGEVPSDFDSLLSLAGVGRKTANVVSAVAFGEQTMPVDTHVLRLSNRIGLASSDKPAEVERTLVSIVPHDRLTQAHHLLIHHGRYICTARAPHCDKCAITDYCRFFKEGRL
ncbi:MAG: endonuclease III [Clostridia bacterium]|nr:endonuclease III [Clostridia bacterium]